MTKVHRIITGTTLLAVFAFIMVVWANGRPTRLTHPSIDSTRAVQLRFTFASGDSANVVEFEGGTITVEKDGKKLAITPYRRDHGQVELRVFQAVQREGKELAGETSALLANVASSVMMPGGSSTIAVNACIVSSRGVCGS